MLNSASPDACEPSGRHLYHDRYVKDHISEIASQNAICYTPSPPQKQDGAGTFATKTRFSNSEYRLHSYLPPPPEYYDYLFDGNMREAAAAYNGEWGAGEDKTWNVVGGLSLTATF